MPKPISGFDSLIDAANVMPMYNNFDGKSRILMRTGLAYGPDAKPITWWTEPWDGNSETLIVFQGSYFENPRCELTINESRTIPFVPQMTNMTWVDGAARLKAYYMGERECSHAVFALELPAEPAAAGRKIHLRLRVVGGSHEASWFGLRDMKHAADFLP